MGQDKEKLIDVILEAMGSLAINPYPDAPSNAKWARGMAENIADAIQQHQGQGQPIETAPKDGTPILTYAAGYDIYPPQYAVMRWSDPIYPWASWELTETGGYAGDAYPSAQPELWWPLPKPSTVKE